jgi:hypothetical protein
MFRHLISIAVCILVPIMYAVMLALTATTAGATETYEKVSFSIREPFELGTISTVFTGDHGVPANETVFWARPDVLFIGRQATPCLIDWVPGQIGNDKTAKLFVCWLGLDNEYHRGPQGAPTLPK